MSLEPKVGDLIEIFRPVYQHWAIYVGDGYVIHLAPPSEYARASSVMMVFCDTGVVKKEKLSEVVEKDRYKINNFLDNKYKPRDISQILKEAHSLVGKKITYSVVRRNCEHFVTELRYGKPTSRQVQEAMIAGGIAVGVVGLAVLAGALFLDSGKEKKKKNKYKNFS